MQKSFFFVERKTTNLVAVKLILQFDGTFENQFNIAEVGITKKLTTQRRGKQLPTRSNETESKPPAQSPEEDYSYYRQFPP